MLSIGQVVQVGPKYVMAKNPPFAGNGRHEADEWTGRQLRVVAVRPARPELGLAPMASLAPVELLNPDESDEVVSIAVRRLTPA